MVAGNGQRLRTEGYRIASSKSRFRRSRRPGTSRRSVRAAQAARVQFFASSHFLLPVSQLALPLPARQPNPNRPDHTFRHLPQEDGTRSDSFPYGSAQYCPLTPVGMYVVVPMSMFHYLLLSFLAGPMPASCVLVYPLPPWFSACGRTTPPISKSPHMAGLVCIQ